MSDLADQLPDVPALLTALDDASYLADEPLGTALFLAARMGQPILLEGEPGVGKTEAAKALAAVLDTPLIRLQCYEGLTSAEALYEWNYPRQLLAIRLAEARGESPREADLFSDGPLAVHQGGQVVAKGEKFSVRSQIAVSCITGAWR